MFIEGAPFGDWEKLKSVNGKETCDSVVGLVNSDNKRRWIAKWNRKQLHEVSEVKGIALYMCKAYALYLKVLGSDFIVPSFFSIGEKITYRNRKRGEKVEMDSSFVKRGFKLYTFQPFIENAFPAGRVPKEILSSDLVMDQWRILRPRLYNLYTTARRVNREFSEDNRFPIGLTLGPVRRVAYDNDLTDFEQQLSIPPSTPNILITKNSPPRILIVDLGTYYSWNIHMNEAYRQIWNSTITV